MAPLDYGPPAGGKLTKWPAVSKRLDSTVVVCWACNCSIFNVVFARAAYCPVRQCLCKLTLREILSFALKAAELDFQFSSVVL